MICPNTTSGGGSELHENLYLFYGCLPFTWANRSVHGSGKWFVKFRTGKFRPGIAFATCTNQFHLPENGREGLEYSNRKTGLPFRTFRCSQKFTTGKTQTIVSDSLSNRISRKIFVNGKQLLFYKPGSFFINALSLTNTLYSGTKNKLLLDFLIQKKFEKNWRVIDPCGYRNWPLCRHFSHLLLFHFFIFLKTEG